MTFVATYDLFEPNTSVTEARKLAKRLTPTGTNIVISKNTIGGGQYNPSTKELQAIPSRFVVAHEATHARQHQTLGRSIGPLYAGTPWVGTLGGVGLSIAQSPAATKHWKKLAKRGGRTRKLAQWFLRGGKRRWLPMGIAAAGHVPKLAMEGHANIAGIKETGEVKPALISGGSYLGAAAIDTALTSPLMRRGSAAFKRRMRRNVGPVAGIPRNPDSRGWRQKAQERWVFKKMETDPVYKAKILKRYKKKRPK